MLGQQAARLHLLERLWKLKLITNRGVKVYPDGLPETFCTDHWRCRFLARDDGIIRFDAIVELLRHLGHRGFQVIKTRTSTPSTASVATPSAKASEPSRPNSNLRA